MRVCKAASVVSDSLWPYGLYPASFHCPWDSPSKNTGVSCHALLQRIFPTQGFPNSTLFLFSFIFISWRLITLQYCSGFCHTLTWISHGFTCIPHPDTPSHLPLHPIPLGLPSAPGLSTLLCLMHWQASSLPLVPSGKSFLSFIISQI